MTLHAHSGDGPSAAYLLDQTESTLIERIFSRCVKEENECLIWLGANVRGHGQIYKRGYVHRIVYNYYYGEPKADLVVAHTCDNGLCCNPLHLEAITRAQNTVDAFARRRYQRAQYGKADVESLRNGQLNPKEFSLKFSVTLKTAYNIKLGWKGNGGHLK